VPVLAMLKAELLPALAALPLGAAILLSALYHFSDTESKAEDNSFIGFPAIWNVVALYLFVFAPEPGIAALICIACIVLTFVPTRWVHPMRVARWRGATLLALVAWFAAAAACLAFGLGDSPVWARIVLAAVAAYAIAVPLLAGRDRAHETF
jgi:phosphatidylcholine synthase